MPSPTTPATTNPVTTATGSSALSTAALSEQLLNSLPARMTPEQETALEQLCRSASPAPQTPAGEAHYAKVMRCLSILPRRVDDELKGELRDALYERKLGHLTAGALNYLGDKALERCTFFPSIKECLEIAAEWKPPVDTGLTLRNRALGMVRNSRQLRFDDAMAQLAARAMTQPEIDALPEQWKMIAVERCYLWLHPDLTFTVRRDPDAGRFCNPDEQTLGPIKPGIADDLGLRAGVAA